jgi:hypothetical protein
LFALLNETDGVDALRQQHAKAKSRNHQEVQTAHRTFAAQELESLRNGPKMGILKLCKLLMKLLKLN